MSHLRVGDQPLHEGHLKYVSQSHDAEVDDASVVLGGCVQHAGAL
jgi:nicotinamide mononucleotide adenylyltransferase